MSCEVGWFYVIMCICLSDFCCMLFVGVMEDCFIVQFGLVGFGSLLYVVVLCELQILEWIVFDYVIGEYECVWCWLWKYMGGVFVYCLVEDDFLSGYVFVV